MGTTFNMYCKDCDKSIDLGKSGCCREEYEDILAEDLEHIRNGGDAKYNYMKSYVETSNTIHDFIFKHSGHRIYYFSEHNMLHDYLMGSCTLEEALNEWTGYY